jgi:rhodanese-related sulfurtransferase
MDSTISTKDLKSKLDKKQGITVVETLAPERYREAHIPGALNIPPEQIRELAPQLLPNKNAEIVTFGQFVECWKQTVLPQHNLC